MIERVKKWLAPPAFPGDEEKTAWAGILNRLGHYYVSLLIIFELIFVPFLALHKWETTGIVFELVLFYLISREFIKHGRLKTGMGVLTATSWLIMLVVTIYGGGVSSPLIFGVIGATIVANLLVDQHTGTAFTAISILALLFISLAQQSGASLPRFFVYTPLSTWFLLSLVLLFVQWMTNTVVRYMRSTVQASRRHEQNLRDAQEDLRKDAERLRQVLDTTSSGYWDWNLVTDEIFYSDGYLAQLGYTRAEFAHTNTEWEALVHPDDIEAVHHADARSFDKDDTFTGEFRLRAKSGEWHWVLSRGMVIERDAQGLALRMVGTHTDIHSLKITQEALRESQTTISTIINSTPDLIWSVDAETFSLQTFNEGYNNFFIKTRGFAVALGMRPDQLYPTPEYIHRWYDFYQRALREGSFTSEYEVFAGTHILELNFNRLERGGRVYGISVFGRDISELKEAGEALRESETRFRSISENALTGMYIIQRGRLTYVNAALANILGYSVAELTGADPLQTIEPRDRETVIENLRRRITGESTSIHYEFHARTKDGSVRLCDVLGTRVELDGAPAIIGTILDITERRQAEEDAARHADEISVLNEIGQSFSRLVDPSEIPELLYKSIGRVLDNSNLYIAVYDENTDYISFPVYSMHGQRVDGGGRKLADGLTDYIIRTNQPLLIRTSMDAGMTALGIGLYGTPACSYLAVPIHLEQRVLGVIALQDYERENMFDEHDLELLSAIASQAAIALENARLFQAVQTSETRFRTVVEHNHDGILMLNSQRQIIFISPSYTQINGYQPEEVLESPGADHVHPDDRPLTAQVFASLAQTPGSFRTFQYRIIHKDGHSVWVETTATNLLAEPGIGALVLNTRDISERRLAEAALRESEERYRTLIDNSPNVMVMHSGGRVEFVNPTAVRLLGGTSEDQFLGQPVMDFVHPDQRELLIERMRSVYAGTLANPTHEYIFIRLDGQPIHLEVTTTPFSFAGKPAFLSTGIDLSERLRANAALRESEERYRVLIEHSPNGIVVHRDKLIEFINPAGVELMGGKSAAEFIGRQVMGFVHPDKRPLAEQRLEMLKDGQPLPPVETIYLRLDGSLVHVETTLAPIVINGKPAAVATITNITERKRAQEALERRNAYLRALQETALELASQLDLNILLENIARRAGKLVGTGSAYLDLVDPDSDRMIPTVGLGLMEPSLKLEIKRGESITGRVWETRKPVLVEDFDNWPDHNPAFPKGMVRSILSVPLLAGSEVLGVLGLANSRDDQHSFGEEEVILLTDFARLAVLAINNARLYQRATQELEERKQTQEALQRQNVYLQALQATALELTSQLDLPILLENITRRAGELVGTHSAYLELVDKSRNLLIPTVGLGALTETLRKPTLPGEGITGQVWLTNQPMIVEDYDNWSERKPYYSHNLVRSIMAVPLTSGDEVLGVLGLSYGPESPRVFGQEELNQLAEFARLAVIAIQNATLYQRATQEILERTTAETKLEKRAAQMTLIMNVGQKIAGVLDPRDLLNLAATLVAESFGYHHVALFVLNEERNELIMRARAGQFTSVFPENHSIKLGEGMVGSVARTGHRILARDVTQERHYKNYYPGVIPTRSEVSIPLKVGRLVVGVLDVQSPKLNAFGIDDLNVLQTLSDEVAVALENARLYDSVHRELAERRQVEAELRKYRAHLEEMVSERTSQLQIAMREAEAANRAKSDFLAVMSHEIRTPLNGVLGLTHLALQTTLTNKQRDYLSRVEDSGESLLAIINDILDFSKIESGKLELEHTDFDLDDVLRSLSNVLAFHAGQKEIELVYHTGPDLPRLLVGDGQRLRQILLNLTGNAVKFTERGEVVLRISLLNRVEDRAEIEFSVSDTGIGMTPEQMVGLFQPFSQVDSSTSRKYGGTGLGLAISQRLVRLMGGEIAAQSAAGQGTVFTFRLTLNCQPNPNKNSFTPPRELGSLRILAVDSHPAMRDFLATSLTAFSYRVTTVPGVLPALELLSAPTGATAFDLLLMGGSLPGEPRGLEAVRTLRQQPALQKSRVILLVSPQEIFNHAPSDLDGFLLKPATRSQLFDSIMNTFGFRAGETGAPATSHTLPDPTPLRGRRVLVVEDNRINQLVARDMLEGLGLLVEVADSGEQAFQILCNGAYDAVLMDIQMPGMDGYETTALIRGVERFVNPRLPVIAMTAHALTSDRDKALSAGLDDYISKPVDITQLTRTLLRWLPETPAAALETPESPSAPAAPRPAPEPPGSLPAQITNRLNTAAAINRLGGDRLLYRRILGLFYSEHAGMLADLRQALGRGEAEQARNLSHSLKGLAGSIGADEIMAISKQLEAAIAAGDESLVQDCLADLQPRFDTLLAALKTLEG